MEKQSAKCEDGRTRQARVYGESREDGDFEVRKAGVRVKGKHVSGEAWYSRKTGTWYFLTDPECKNSHLLYRSYEKHNEESIKKMLEKLKVLETRYAEEKKEFAKHRDAMIAVESEIETLKQGISRLKKRIPFEPGQKLIQSLTVRTS